MTKTICITGASRGIGFEVAKQAAARNYKVIALSRNTSSLEQLDGVDAFPLDITDEMTLSEYISTWTRQGIRIDALINNAGALRNLPFDQTTIADFEAVYKVNVFGLASVTRHLLPLLNVEGHVLNISSMGGMERTSKFPGLAAYSSSKAAVNILTELLAEEYNKTGPAFNALALGSVQTEMLQAAFPGFDAPLSAKSMGSYVLRFALEGQQFFNGKIIPVASTTP